MARTTSDLVLAVEPTIRLTLSPGESRNLRMALAILDWQDSWNASAQVKTAANPARTVARIQLQNIKRARLLASLSQDSADVVASLSLTPSK